MPPAKRRTRKPKPKLGFISYSHKDTRRCDELREHLALLERQQIVHAWHDGEINQKVPWDKDIKDHLKAAKLVLLLVSARFIRSYYCYEVEMAAAMERHRQGKTVVLPVLIASCDYESAPFARLNVFHINGKPICGNRDRRDAGWAALAKKVRTILTGK